jgi:hypothetical protein
LFSTRLRERLRTLHDPRGGDMARQIQFVLFMIAGLINPIFESRRIAANIAKVPELLGRKDYFWVA